MSIDTAHICKWLSMLQPMHHTGAQSKNDFQLCMMDPGCHYFPARFLNSERQKLFLCFLRKHLSLSAHELCWHSVLNNKVPLRSSGVIRLLSKALLALRGKEHSQVHICHFLLSDDLFYVSYVLGAYIIKQKLPWERETHRHAFLREAV